MLKTLLAPYLGWIYGAAALAAVAGGIWTYNTIYDRGYQAASVHFELQALDQEAANKLAIRKAEDMLRGDIAKLIQEKKDLEDEVARLNQEAAQDPGADDGALGAGSVQRLNSIR